MQTSVNKAKVTLAGCNSEWAQKHYLPFLLEMAAKGEIMLWATDIQPDIKLCSADISNLWQIASSNGNAFYLNPSEGRESYDKPSNIDYVFVVTADRYHCEVAEQWLNHLNNKGRIFIEKPLDVSIESAKHLKERLDNINVICGFDHYLAMLYPFLLNKRKHLDKIGDIQSIQINILEKEVIPPERINTLHEGIIFDLGPHIFSAMAAVVGKELSPTLDTLLTINEEKINVLRAKYNGCAINNETWARIKFFIGNKMVSSEIGKGVDRLVKNMVIHGNDGGKIEIFFKNNNISDYSFFVNSFPEGKLEANHVERFLEIVLKGVSAYSTPGVMSFYTAYAILEKLNAIRNQPSVMQYYNVGDIPNSIE